MLRLLDARSASGCFHDVVYSLFVECLFKTFQGSWRCFDRGFLSQVVHSGCVRGLFPVDSGFVHIGLAVYSRFIHGVFIHALFTVYSSRIRVYRATSLIGLTIRFCGCWTRRAARPRLCPLASASGLFRVWSQFIYGLSPIYSRIIHGIFAVYSESAHTLFSGRVAGFAAAGRARRGARATLRWPTTSCSS